MTHIVKNDMVKHEWADAPMAPLQRSSRTPHVTSWSDFWKAVCAYPVPLAGGQSRRLHAALLHGKGARAKIVYDVACAYGGLQHGHVAFAAAVEAIHAASLCHDDVLDNGDMRRGQRCIHRTHGVRHAILLGDALMAAAFRVIDAVNVPKLTPCMAQCVSYLVEGQLTEYTLHRQSSPYDCIRTAYLKTGCLFGSAAKGSGLIAHASPLTARTLYRRGCRAGVAFQLHDDCNEYTAPPDQWTTAHDIIQGQWTLPLIHACGTPHIDHAVRDVQRDITNTKAKQRLARLMGPSIAAVRHLAQHYDQCAHQGMTATLDGHNTE